MSGRGRPSTVEAHLCLCGATYYMARWYYESRLRRSKSKKLFCGNQCPAQRIIRVKPPISKPRDEWAYIEELRKRQ